MTLRETLAAAAALALGAAPARAGFFENYGYTGRGAGTASALVAGEPDASASYYNPAGTVGGDRIAASFGFGFSLPALYIDRFKTDSEVQSSLPPPYAGVEIGLRLPLGGKLINHRAALGVGVHVPAAHVVSVNALDQKTPQFYLYQSFPDKVAVLVSLGVQVHDWVSLGVGAYALGGLIGQGIDLEIDLFKKRFEKRSLAAAIENSVAPTAGVLFGLPIGEEGSPRRLRLGFSWRGELELPVDLPTTIDLGDVGTLALDIKARTHWTPHELTLGAMYRHDEKLAAYASLSWALWSRAPNPQVSLAVDLKGEIAESLGLDQALSFDSSSDRSPGFVDILVPRVGLEFQPAPSFTLRGGYWLRPTPVKDQVQKTTNYVDSTAHGAAVGASFSFQDPIELLPNPLTIDATGQFVLLQERLTTKKEAADPVGSYKSGGFVVHLDLTLRYTF